MRKILLLILILLSVSYGVQRNWTSTGSTNANLSTNYDGSGDLLATDTVLLNGTSDVDWFTTAALSVNAIIVTSAYTGVMSDSLGAITLGAGGFLCNTGGSLKIVNTFTSAGRDSIARGAGTGTLRLMNGSIIRTGDNNFYLAWPEASIDSSGSNISLPSGAASTNRYLGLYFDMQGSGRIVNQTGDDYISPKVMKLAYTSKACSISTAQWHPWQLITDSGTVNFITSGETIDTWIYGDTCLQFTNTTFSGVGGLQLVGNYQKWTIPKIRGTVTDVSILSYKSSGIDTITATDTISAVTISWILRDNGSSAFMDMRGKTLNGALRVQNVSHNDSFTIRLDSINNGLLAANNAISSTSTYGKKAKVYVEGALIQVRNSADFSAWLIQPHTNMTLQYVVATASTHTNGEGNEFHKIILNKSTTSTRLTVADSLICDSLVLTKGRLYQNGKKIYCKEHLLFNSATSLDSNILSAPIYLDGNLTAVSGAQFFFNTGAKFVMTANYTHTITTGGKRLDTVQILGPTTITGGDTLCPKITGAKVTFQTGQNFTFLPGYDIDGSNGNLDSIVGGNIDIPANDSVDYVYFQNVTLASGDTIWAGINSVDGGGNTNIVFGVDTIPTITSITPEQVGPGDTVTLAGTGFGDSTTVKVRNNFVTPIANDSVSFKWIATACPEGPQTVILTNVTYNTSDTTTLYYDTIPALVSCSPDTGNFRETKNVTLNVIAPGGQVIDTVWEDDSLCTIVSKTDSTVVVTIPAHVEVSDVDVRTCSKDGYRDTLPNGFTHVNMDTIPAMVSALPLYSKLVGGGHGTITGTGMSAVDSVWYGDSLAVIDLATYTTLYTTIPAYGVRGGLPIRTHAVYGYRDTLLAGITYKNIHITGITPVRGVAGDTLDFHFLWGAGTSGLAVTMGDSAATVVAGYADTLARVVAPVHANGNVQVRAINGAGDTTYSQWIYGTANKRRSGFGLGLGTGWLFGF